MQDQQHKSSQLYRSALFVLVSSHAMETKSQLTASFFSHSWNVKQPFSCTIINLFRYVLLYKVWNKKNYKGIVIRDIAAMTQFDGLFKKKTQKIWTSHFSAIWIRCFLLLWYFSSRLFWTILEVCFPFRIIFSLFSRMKKNCFI